MTEEKTTAEIKEDNLKLFYCLGLIPEKVIPWHADVPTYFDVNKAPSSLNPGNFKPNKDWNHLHLVAKKLSIEDLPTNLDYAYEVVLHKVREVVKDVDVRSFLTNQFKRRNYPN